MESTDWQLVFTLLSPLPLLLKTQTHCGTVAFFPTDHHQTWTKASMVWCAYSNMYFSIWHFASILGPCQWEIQFNWKGTLSLMRVTGISKWVWQRICRVLYTHRPTSHVHVGYMGGGWSTQEPFFFLVWYPAVSSGDTDACLAKFPLSVLDSAS